MAQQRVPCPLRLPEPGISAAHCQTRWQPLLGRRTIRVIIACGKDDFDGAKPLHLTPRGRMHLLGRSGNQLRRRELTRGEIGISDPRPRPFANDRRDVGVSVAVEHGRVGHRPRRHDAGHVAVDQGPAAVQTADLLADGDFVTGRDEPGDVPVSRVVRDPGHGSAGALAHLSAREHDIQHTRRGFRVVLEGLVEIPKAE